VVGEILSSDKSRDTHLSRKRNRTGFDDMLLISRGTTLKAIRPKIGNTLRAFLSAGYRPGSGYQPVYFKKLCRKLHVGHSIVRCISTLRPFDKLRDHKLNRRINFRARADVCSALANRTKVSEPVCRTKFVSLAYLPRRIESPYKQISAT